MMSCFALIIAFVQKDDPEAGLGTVVALMLPYSAVFLAARTLFLVVWALPGIPVGPDAPLLRESPLHVQQAAGEPRREAQPVPAGAPPSGLPSNSSLTTITLLANSLAGRFVRRR
jgi:hypothetical protein